MNNYRKVENISDLQKLAKEAKEYNLGFVGISNGGELYTLNPENKAMKISFEKAMEILNVDSETMKRIVDSRGTYEIPNEILEETPIPIVAAQEEEPIQNQTVADSPENEEQEVHEEKPNPESDLSKLISDFTKSVNDLKDILNQHKTDFDSSDLLVQKKLDDILSATNGWGSMITELMRLIKEMENKLFLE